MTKEQCRANVLFKLIARMILMYFGRQCAHRTILDGERIARVALRFLCLLRLLRFLRFLQLSLRACGSGVWSFVRRPRPGRGLSSVHVLLSGVVGVLFSLSCQMMGGDC